MDEVVYAPGIGFDAELLGLFCGRAGEPLTFPENFIYRHGFLRLLGFSFLDKVRYPTCFVAVTLAPKPMIDAHHLAEEFALGAALFLGEVLDFLYQSRRRREPE